MREPREKKKVLRRDRAVRWDPERIVRRREEGRAFHKEGAMEAKDLVWAIAVLTRGTRRTRMHVKRAE